MSKLYTIGYATKPIDVFIAQLQHYSINVVADIRSVPYSKIFHDYHKEALHQHLQANNIRYIYLGEELGPRSKDDCHYDNTGQVQFDRLMQSPLFLQGIKRLEVGLKKEFSIALMCAEKDAATCHRSLLVGYFLARHAFSESNVDILHINHNGDAENQQPLEQRVAVLNKISSDLFSSQKEREQQAYQLQLKNTSYRRK